MPGSWSGIFMKVEVRRRTVGGPAGSSGWEGVALPRGLFGLDTEHVLSRFTLGCPISLAGCSVYWGPHWGLHLPHPFLETGCGSILSPAEPALDLRICSKRGALFVS